jgi:HD-like signal output (HDOD) protein
MSNENGNETEQAKASATLAQVRMGIDSGSVPLVSQIVKIIRDISGKADTMSVHDLADSISCDPATMSRIIAIASTLGYNPSGVQITSIHHAISIVGFERVRNVAVSILLLEHAQSQFTAEVNREQAGVALASGMMASEMCRRGLSIEPGTAFVCSALRSYGRMLMATFLEKDYATVIAMNGAKVSDEVFKATFGLTPLDLGRELLTSQQLPPIILDTLITVPMNVREEASKNPSELLSCVAEFGSRMAEILQSPDLTSENFSWRIEALSREYDRSFYVSKDEAKSLVKEVFAALQHIGSKGGVSLNSIHLLKRINSLANGLPLPPVFKPVPKTATGGPAPVPGTYTTAPVKATDPAKTSALLDATTLGIDELLKAPQPDLRRIFEYLLKSLHEALHFNSGLVYLNDPKEGSFRLVCGAGPLFDGTRSSVILDPAKRDIFCVPLKRGEDVLIQNPEEPSISPFVPPWLRQPGCVLPVLLLPIRGADGPFALVCATTTGLSSFALVEQVASQLRRLRARLYPLGGKLGSIKF